MIDGDKLGTVGFEKLGTPYRKMDCQAFVEWCLRQCGLKKDLAGSNAWYREVMKNGWIGSPEACVKQFGKVPAGAFLFIHAFDGGEERRGYRDGLGNASHIGIATGKGEGAIHSSSSRGCVAESSFRNKTVPNGGWNRVGLWTAEVRYAGIEDAEPENCPRRYAAATQVPGLTKAPLEPLLRKGSRGEAVREMQAALIARGYDLGRWGADGIFGNQTLEAVKAFQKDCGIKADGVFGRITYDCLWQESRK